MGRGGCGRRGEFGVVGLEGSRQRSGCEGAGLRSFWLRARRGWR